LTFLDLTRKGEEEESMGKNGEKKARSSLHLEKNKE